MIAVALRAMGRAVSDQYRIGLGLFVAAPIAVMMAAGPEFVQHVVEIHLGMFASHNAARALANDPRRWAFGYVKLVGVLFSLFACARAAWCRLEGGASPWYDLRTVGWRRLAVGFALFMAIGSLPALARGMFSPPMYLAVETAFSIASLPFIFIALAGWFGDRATPWRQPLTRGWPAVALLLVLFVTGFVTMQGLHLLDHRLALGRPAIVAWVLMAWDALVVGATTALMGTGFALAYAAARDRALFPLVAGLVR